MVPRTVDPEGQAQDSRYGEAAEVQPAFAVQQEEQGRKEEIELLLDAQTPEVGERSAFSGIAPVAPEVFPYEEIGKVGQREEAVQPRLDGRIGRQAEVPKHQRDAKGHGGVGQESQGPTEVEFTEGKSARLEVG